MRKYPGIHAIANGMESAHDGGAAFPNFAMAHDMMRIVDCET